VRIYLVPSKRVTLAVLGGQVWGYHPSDMNTEWMGERVATVDLSRILANMMEVRRPWVSASI
jgi:hypothetical protein